jgi:hypothetical protein
VNDGILWFSVIGWVRIIGELMMGTGIECWSGENNGGIGTILEDVIGGINAEEFEMGKGLDLRFGI